MTINRYWYRHQFERLFPQEACVESVMRWIPRADWGCPSDPSGRAQKIHSAAYKVETATSSMTSKAKEKEVSREEGGRAVA